MSKPSVYAFVGTGLFSLSAAVALRRRDSQAIIHLYEARQHPGGNIYDRPELAACSDGIARPYHMAEYGAHIFHTNSTPVYEFLNHFFQFQDYQHEVLGEGPYGVRVPVPINLDTIRTFYPKVTSEQEARDLLASFAADVPGHPSNLEDWCLKHIGPILYRKVIAPYTRRQWGVDDLTKLPASIVQRLPIHFDTSRTYFRNAKHQGMPSKGYTAGVNAMLAEIGSSFSSYGREVTWSEMDYLAAESTKVIYTGPLDRLLAVEPLPYRSIRFEHALEVIPPGVTPVVNNLRDDAYVSPTQRYTRTLYHSRFYLPESTYAMVTREFPAPGGEAPYYPVRTDEAVARHAVLLDAVTSRWPNVCVGGRLGDYQYYDMDQATAAGMKLGATL